MIARRKSATLAWMLARPLANDPRGGGPSAPCLGVISCLMRQKNWNGGMLHDMPRHAAEQKLPVMAVRVGAHDNETCLVRARARQQAHAYRSRFVGRNSVRDDVMPAQVTRQLRRLGMM